MADTPTLLTPDRVAEGQKKIARVVSELRRVHPRQGPGDRRGRHRPAGARPRAARRPARPRQDRTGQGAVAAPLARRPPHPVHARPAADRHHRQSHPAGARRAAGVRLPRRADLHEPPAGRRDQPRLAQDAVGPARGDAGAARDDVRRDAAAAGAVLRAGDAESDRTRRDVPAPEAQLDRFMFKVEIAGVDRAVLEEILVTRVHGEPPLLEPVLSAARPRSSCSRWWTPCTCRAPSPTTSRASSLRRIRRRPTRPEAVRTFVKYGSSPRGRDRDRRRRARPRAAAREAERGLRRGATRGRAGAWRIGSCSTTRPGSRAGTAVAWRRRCSMSVPEVERGLPRTLEAR